MELRIPPEVTKVLARLRGAGYEGYVVGGCVRDAIRGVEPDDWDVATNARPEEIQKLFRRSLYVNRFGTVIVKAEKREIEVTTYRIEADYADHRRPESVSFTDSLHEDLSRRDFTMNAMAWHPSQIRALGGDPSGRGEFGVGAYPQGARTKGELVDPFGGRADLEARIVRAVGDPEERFHEDALRMLRAARFATTLGFRIDQATAAAIRRNAALAETLSGERLQQEIGKILRAPAPSVGFRMLSDLGLLAVIAPELERCRETPQDKLAAQDVFEHSLATLDAAATIDATTGPDLSLRLAALLHDVGKPDTFADGHFHQHEFVGEAKARQLLRRWRFPKEIVTEVSHLVRNHMFWYQTEWTDSAVRRFIRKIGLEHIPVLFALRKADNIGSGARAPRMDALEQLWLRVQEEIQRANALSKRDLAVDGHDIMAELGIPPGPEVGRVLDLLFERVLDDPELNTRDALLALAREVHSGTSPPPD